jgi:hypothetical protein
MVLPLFTQHMYPDFRKYLLNRGLQEDKEQGCILIPNVCQHLKLVTCPDPMEMMYLCDIHDDPDRPEVCRKFRGQKIIKGSRIYVPPECNYREDSI